MTQSRYKQDLARFRAREAADAPFVEALERHRDRYPTIIKIRRELKRYRDWPVKVWTIWLGPEEYTAWRREFADQFDLGDVYDGVPIVRVKDPGISVMCEPLDA